MKKSLPLLANLGAQLIFGFGLLFVRACLAAVGQDVIKYLAFRFTIGFLFMTVLVALRVVKVNYRGKPIKYLLLCGLFNPVLSQIFETIGIKLSPTAQVAMLGGVAPIVTLVLGALCFRERLTRRGVLFCCLSVSGVILTSIGPMEGSSFTGMLCIMLFVISTAFSRLFLRRARESFSSFEAIYVTTGMGAVAFCVETFVMHAARGELAGFFDGVAAPSFIVPFLYMGIISCVCAFCLTAYSSSLLSIEAYAVLNNVSTVISILVGVFILREQVQPMDIIGAVIILIGAAGANLTGRAPAPVPVPEEEG